MLCLSLLLFSIHGWFHIVSNNSSTDHFNPTATTTTTQPYALGSHHRQTLSNRKALLAAKFDFTPYVHRHHQQHRLNGHVPVRPEPGGAEIDPRYGSEMRLVPTGPNPLHH
ncbi:hypothetical protein Pyn_04521 [Prunus yedoensis var. nudiflora]|uniref:CLAVATA3/ESR (CLE)-related protein 13 n=1 Tax=Prunus yedoensis var. nudiflora TaxID=2094558 RepID=A0A314XJ20_PRUYE|nr:hypothetical protein Pyn_04521 [Prunus yedoensis var. nudiflora]